MNEWINEWGWWWWWYSHMDGGGGALKFLFWKGRVDGRCVGGAFGRLWWKGIEKGDDESSHTRRSREGKRLKRWSVCIDRTRGAFGVLITQAGRAEQRRWKVLHHSWSADSYPVAHRAFALTLIFSLGQISEEQFYPNCFKRNSWRSTPLSDHVLSVSVNDNVIVKTQFSISWSCCIFDDSSHLL